VGFDAAGNLFIADQSNNRIRKVATNGIISTVAGNGSTNYTGDGGAATNAGLNHPAGVCFDAAGNLYIADQEDSRIRVVGTNGIITTAAGNGTAGYAGDGGAATNASLGDPYGVTCDASGNLYIADTGNSRVREVHFAGFPALTLTNATFTNAGNYSVVITSPYGSVTSAVASLTVYLPTIITMQPASQFVVVGNDAGFSVAATGTGPFDYEWYWNTTNLVQSGTNSSLPLPDVSMTNAGNYSVVVANAFLSVTSQVATLSVGVPSWVVTQPGSQTNLAGATANFSITPGGPGPFTYQWQLNGTNLPSGIITTVAGNGGTNYTGDGGAATNAGLDLPGSVALDAAGNLYIADQDHNRIRMVAANGIITTVAGNGTNSFSGDGGPAANAGLNDPANVAVDAAGNLYIADWYNNRIRKVATNGIITTVAGKGTYGYSGDGGAATNADLYYPAGLAVDAAGDLYIADWSNRRIREVNPNGLITTVAGDGGYGYTGDGGPATNATLYYPASVTVDAAGNLYVADCYNHRIRRVGTNSLISTVAGNGAQGYTGDGGAATNASLYYPQDAAMDAAGNLFIADFDNNRIRRVDTSGLITTVAGNGTAGFSGDGGAATNASLWRPAGVAFDAMGNLYIADTDNNRIREVLLYAEYPTLTLNNLGAAEAGNYSVVITSPYGSVTSSVAALTIVFPPAISVQPCAQAVLAGSNVTLSVTATGTAPLIYSWCLMGTNLVQCGPNCALTLPNVMPIDAGNYTVVVANGFGSVTSAVAALTVTIPNTPPQIITGDGNFGFLTNQFGFNLNGAFGQTVVVDGSTNLVDWIPIFTNTANGSPFYFYDPVWTNFPWRFYRARLP
jgi:sugar lactone lactonase YvrE